MARTFVITAARDPTADLLEASLEEEGIAVQRVVIDRNNVPTIHVDLAEASQSQIEADRERIDLSDVEVIFFRKPESPGFPDSAEEDEKFLAREALGGLRAALDSTDAIWINHPTMISQADSKPTNLRLARRLGLRIPDTVVSSDPDSISDWLNYRSERDFVIKAVSHGLIRSPEKSEMVFTQPLPDGFEPGKDMEPGVPVLIQERVEKDADVRVNVIGEKAFAARLEAAHGVLDWRTTNHGDRWEPVELPDHIRKKILKMCNQLGLRFAAIDFVVSDGDWFFLEVNPNGQWAWLEEESGQALSVEFSKLARRHLPTGL